MTICATVMTTIII